MLVVIELIVLWEENGKDVDERKFLYLGFLVDCKDRV